MTDVSRRARSAGRRLDDSDLLDHLVRFGLVANGLVYLLVGWLALQLAFGDAANASSQGALHTLARQPFGVVLVWAVAVGLFVLVLWRVLEALGGHRDEEGGTRLRKRLVSAGKALVYAVLGVSAVQVATSSGSSSGGATSTTATLMDLPAGQWLVAAAGLGIVAYGAALVVTGWTEKFRKRLDSEGTSGTAGRVHLLMGKVGYSAKGIAFAVIGGFVTYAGITHDARKSTGLDQALGKVLHQPFGPVLLTAIAVGIVCFGLFCFARARHLAR
jgi:hypothetical protein